MPTALLAMSPSTFELQFGAAELDRLRQLVTLEDPPLMSELSSPEARSRLADVDVLITSWGAPALTAEVLDAAPRLGAVLHAAGTVRGIVTDAVHERGIVVSTSASANAVPVAEYTLAAIILAGKRAPFWNRRGAGDWDGTRVDHPDQRAPRLGNRGRRIGIVGFSRTGRRVMELLRVLATDEILVADPYADPSQVAGLGGRLADLDEVVAGAEILSLHAPSTPETRHMIGERELAMMPDGATLINTARGALVDHEALAAACAGGRIDAVLDVTDPEPLPAASLLHRLDNVVITPHIAGSLGAETRRMSGHALDELERWLRGDQLHELVRREEAATSA